MDIYDSIDQKDIYQERVNSLNLII